MIPDHHSRGGRARAAKLSPERRHEIASLAAQKRWNNNVDEPIRDAILKRLRSGEIDVAMAADLAERGRPTIRTWAETEAIDLDAARASRVAALRNEIAVEIAPSPRKRKPRRTLGDPERRYVRRGK